ncbi:MAG: hypothetical protein IPL61_18815 [Myxococcales bacterium]|nr:hypothetical protein [Myxococcales bacterium]
MRTRLAAALALALAACLPAADSPQASVECEVQADCNGAAGEVCDVGVCWGDPPTGRYSALVTPPTELRGALVKTAIADLTMAADGTLGNGIDQALILDAAVTVRGTVTIPCPPTGPACVERFPLPGQVRFSRAPAFPGGPKVAEVAEVADDGTYQVALARPRAGAPLDYMVTFTPATQPRTPGGRVAAEFLAPAMLDRQFSSDDIDLDTGTIQFDLDLDPAQQRAMAGQLTRPVIDGPVAGWRVVAEVVTNPVVGARQVVSTLAITDEAGMFELRLPTGTDVVDVLLSPPLAADIDHRPSVRMRDVVVSASMPAVDVPLLGQPVEATIAVTGVAGAGGTVAVDGATVVVRLDRMLGGGRELTVEARTTSIGGTATLLLFPLLESQPLVYTVDVLQPPNGELAAHYGETLTPALGGLAVALPRRRVLVGRVRDFEGRGVAGATVTAAVSAASLCVLSSDASRIALGQAPAQATTTSKGEFTLYVDGDLAGVELTYDVTVRPSTTDLRPEWTFLEVSPDGAGDLDLPDAAHVRGLVLAANHGPVANAALTVYEQLDESPGCVSALGTGATAVVRGRGASDDVGSAAVVLPRSP